MDETPTYYWRIIFDLQGKRVIPIATSARHLSLIGLNRNTCYKLKVEVGRNSITKKFYRDNILLANMTRAATGVYNLLPRRQ